MEDDTIKVDISTLGFNLSAIMDFVFQNQHKEKSSEIREVYDKNDAGNLELIQKTLAEVKTQNLDTAASLRYGLIQYLIDQVSQVVMGDNEQDEINDEDEYGFDNPSFVTLGQVFAMNTLINEGMLINVDLKQMIIKDDEQE